MTLPSEIVAVRLSRFRKIDVCIHLCVHQSTDLAILRMHRELHTTRHLSIKYLGFMIASLGKFQPVLVAALLLGAVPVTFAQVVDTVTMSKGLQNNQTDIATTTYVGAAFGTFVSGTNVPAPTLTVPSGSKAGAISFGSGTSDSWSFHSNNFTDMAALNSAYGPGTYQVVIGSKTVTTLGYPSGVFLPNTPLLTMSSGYWSGGQFYTSASAPLTLSSNTFSSNFSFSHSLIELQIYSMGDGAQIADVIATGNQVSLNLPAFSFTSGVSYDVNLTFYTLVNTGTTGIDSLASDDTASLSGADLVATYVQDTHFVLNAANTVSAVPEPSTFGVLAMCFLALPIWLRRGYWASKSSA